MGLGFGDSGLRFRLGVEYVRFVVRGSRFEVWGLGFRGLGSWFGVGGVRCSFEFCCSG